MSLISLKDDARRDGLLGWKCQKVYAGDRSYFIIEARVVAGSEWSRLATAAGKRKDGLMIELAPPFREMIIGPMILRELVSSPFRTETLTLVTHCQPPAA